MPQVLSVWERAFGRVPRLAATAWRRTDVAAASCAPKLFSHSKETFCTLSGDPSNINPGDARLRFLANSKEVGYGNTADLCSQVECQTNGMRATVLDFKDIYNERIRSQLQSRCLILPGAINDISTSFLHDQTFKIVNHNASYIGCFYVMVYWSGCKNDKEWIDFLNHLVDRKIYVIEDWQKSFSTVEVLMYDHGLKQPDDGTDEPFYKGECDASFDAYTKTARLAYIVWKDNKIIYAEVFTSLQCESAAEAEIHAAMALLYKYEELGIRKLQVWSDSRTATSILTGEMPITMGHAKRDFYLMLRHMRTRFKSLVVTWKPRELMVFADFLTRAANLKEDETPESILRISLVKFEDHLRGTPVLRVERTQYTSKAVGKFDEALAKSYGENCKGARTRYIIEVEEDSKFECLLGLYQSLEPESLDLFAGNRGKEDLESLTNQFKSIDEDLDLLLNENGSAGGICCTLRHKESGLKKGRTQCIELPHCTGSGEGYKESGLSTQNLVVLYDYSIAENVAYAHGEFQVLLVTPSERKSMKEKVVELNALGFVYFNGIRE